MSNDILRTVHLRPYRTGSGPTFKFVTWGTGGTFRGKDGLGYRLTSREAGETVVIFECEGFGASPMHAIDSDDTTAAILGFLTLRPGDTDADYFDGYTPAQLAFCDSHAEALSCYVSDRFEARS